MRRDRPARLPLSQTSPGSDHPGAAGCRCGWSKNDRTRKPSAPSDRPASPLCYTAAKGGIAAITCSLAVAYAPQRVRVNAIAPSATMTERVKKLVAGNAALTRLADSHLLGLIEPHDIASMALYLASDESRMVTGQVLPVDSGVTIS